MILLDTMGHLYSDESLQELYNFAVKGLKLKPEWNHYSRHFPHFDLTTKRKKDQALKLGAKLVDAVRDPHYDKAKKVYKQFLEDNQQLEYWYKCKGLHGQEILRIDFKKLGIS